MRVVITGASGGLGEAVVRRFLECGAEVVAAARMAGGPGERLRWVEVDLTGPGAAAHLAEQAGPTDAVVHLVGGFGMGGGLDDWRRMQAINVETAVAVFQAFLPGMKVGGSLIAVGSRAGQEPSPGMAAYAASKAALAQYVRSLAAEVKDRGIRVNAILPSVIDTEPNRKAMPEADFTAWVEPGSIAKVVSWLASEDARDISGALVPVFGRA